MAWLTPSEIEENERRDKEARSRGYRSAFDEWEQKGKAKRDELIRSATQKLSAEELKAIKEKAREDRYW